MHSSVLLVTLQTLLHSAYVVVFPGSSLLTSTKPSTAYSIGRGWHLVDDGVSYYISFSELEEATNNFSKKIGKGSFGTVYYGQMKDGKEVAVKIMADSSSHLTHQFVTEVISNTLLKQIEVQLSISETTKRNLITVSI